MPQPPRVKYADDGDELVIEDESERVVITGNIPVGKVVTGIMNCLIGDKIYADWYYLESPDFTLTGLQIFLYQGLQICFRCFFFKRQEHVRQKQCCKEPYGL